MCHQRYNTTCFLSPCCIHAIGVVAETAHRVANGDSCCVSGRAPPVDVDKEAIANNEANCRLGDGSRRPASGQCGREGLATSLAVRVQNATIRRCSENKVHIKL